MTETLNPLAKALNESLEQASPEVYSMLSALGKRLYFPKGILALARRIRYSGSPYSPSLTALLASGLGHGGGGGRRIRG